MKNIKCFLNGIKNLLLYGYYIPHIYTDVVQKSIIIASKDGFRVSDNYKHEPGEKVYKDGCLIASTCICCGHTEISFCADYYRYIQMNR